MSISDLNRRKKVYPFVRRPPIREAVTPVIEPTIAEWQSYLPASTTPDLDPNSLVSSAAISGDYLEINLQNPGAYPTPPGGAVWDCGSLLDAYGEEYVADGPDTPLLGLRSDGQPPTDTWVGIILANNTPSLTGVEYYGLLIRGDGNITLYNRNSGGSEQTSTGAEGASNLELATMKILPGNTTVSRYAGALGYNDLGVPVASRGLALSFTLGTGGWNRIWLAAGWITGSGGGSTATVRVSGRTLGALISKWISDGNF